MQINSRKMIIETVVSLIIICFILSFFVSVRTINGDEYLKTLNVVWGAKAVLVSGETYEIDKLAPITVSVIASCLSVICAIFIAILLILENKGKYNRHFKVFYLLIALTLIASGVMHFFIIQGFIANSAKKMGVATKAFKEAFKELGVKYRSFTSIILGILTIISGGLIIFNEFKFPHK